MNKIYMILLLTCLLLTSCTAFHSQQSVTYNGTNTVSTLNVSSYSLLDASSNLNNYKANNYTNGVMLYVGSYNASSELNSNLVSILPYMNFASKKP